GCPSPQDGTTEDTTEDTTPPLTSNCGGKCYCCESHTEYHTVTNPDGSTSTEPYTVCDRYCKNYTCHWKECSGCCCVSRSRTYTVDCDAPCPCPSSTCSSDCQCCRRNCPISASLTINPTRLFVNQQYNLAYKASSPSSCCGSLTCTLSCKYEGANCDKKDLLRVCPSDVPSGRQVCPFTTITLSGSRSYSKTISITADKDFWGTYSYELSCRDSCDNYSRASASVFVVSVLYYQEAQPFSKIFSPFLSLIENFKIR
ncbi:MAG: hypothetical protein ACPLYC_01640, partial [Minisyncoccia bacterium]